MGINAMLFTFDAKTLEPSRRPQAKLPIKLTLSAKVSPAPTGAFLESEWWSCKASRELRWDADRPFLEPGNHISILPGMM